MEETKNVLVSIITDLAGIGTQDSANATTFLNAISYLGEYYQVIDEQIYKEKNKKVSEKLQE